MRLRIRTSTGASGVVDNLSPDDNLLELRDAIGKVLGIEIGPSVKIVVGFPPKELPVGPQSLIKESVEDGDTLSVDVGRVKPTKKTPKRTRKRKPDLETTIDLVDGARSDVAEKLAFAAGNPLTALDEISKSFRASFQEEMKKREAERLGHWRYSSALAGTFRLLENKSTSSSFTVSFKAEGKAWLEESYPRYPPDVLQQLIPLIHSDVESRENLRSFNMSIVSPRVFWNVAVQYEGQVGDALPRSQCFMNSVGFVEAALKKICPDLDWSFLSTRKRTLSEKAKRAKELNDIEEDR
uniref:ubiquitinyl hydrolase 1 n=1 Tax=Rhodosorus marinus TaxID=101924 RepID=A0A7S3E9F3_9RHOD|mmetsp:Transcript_16147/g.66736  ORF Transcript_16147/g.66736 Transcript_16147/m.66736 type:complete len:296 (+) Transcript_16147:176-1063(+)